MIPGPWLLDPAIAHLNHGSFSAVPVPVLEAAERWRRLWERDTTQFVGAEWEPALDLARAAISDLVGARAENLVFVHNATAGVNAVFRSIDLTPGDQILTTNQNYNACVNVLRFVAGRSGAEVVSMPLPFPIDDPAEIVDAVIAAVTPRTRYALLDHVTSSTGLILPIERLVTELEAAGVAVMVDGAHAPGMIPLDLEELGASYYTGNNHKWLSAPKGSGFLWVRPDRADGIMPNVISHGWSDERADRPRLHLLFDYQGTDDPSAHLALPDAIAFLETLHPQGLKGLMERNRELVLTQRQRLCRLLGIALPSPDSMIGSLAAVPLPPAQGDAPTGFIDELSRKLRSEHLIQVPVFVWPEWPHRLLRISAAAYNDQADYDRLLEALPAAL